MPRIKNDILPLDLQYQIKKKNLNQRALTKVFNVSDGAISGAINNNPELKNLRKRLIQYLNSIRSNKPNSLKSINIKEVA